ncbi:MAG: hypothetical protein EOM21_15955 [Gammaproteobacteria bacterium]|nr:hypothetical protein [Gammaproteobacteria bacterium]
MTTWEEFTSRFLTGWTIHKGDFYCVIDAEGYWCDSSASFHSAVGHACSDFGDTSEDGLEKTAFAKYSIIHARFLKTLWEAGEVK